MTFCQLYELKQFGRVDDIVGLGCATTSWNIGSGDLMWFASPDECHPFIALNLYRLKDDRFEQIGQSWVKHGFFAQDNLSCVANGVQHCVYEAGHGVGQWLGRGCTDTYSSSLNSNPNRLGPRYEVNPWTGAWTYNNSHLYQVDHNSADLHTAISHRLQVHIADIDPTLNVGASYYMEGYYVIADDMDVMNSASWKPVTPVPPPVGGTVWTFTMSPAATRPELGFAIDAWLGATKTMYAQDNPPIEFVSPDGRCILASKATDLSDGFWRYEFALLNIDMDRQVGSVSFPLSQATTVRNTGFHAPQHHDEPLNAVGGVAIDNNPWTSTRTSTAVTFSTTTNPVRWGTVYNIRFEANVPPVNNCFIKMGLFKPGTPTDVSELSFGPSPGAPTPPDCNHNNVPDEEDIANHVSEDCDANGVPDECQPDCTGFLGIPNACQIASCAPGDLHCQDCNGNGVPDGCDIGSGQSADCNGNLIPDECEPNCDGTGLIDACVISTCAANNPDCADCNGNGIPDSCDIAGPSKDCNNNGVPDECEISSSSGAPGGPFYCTANCESDCNNNGVPDPCDIANATEVDCNANGIPDSCEIAANPNIDCNGNDIIDSCDINIGSEEDCNNNQMPDSCEIAANPTLDCNTNGILDACDITNGTLTDCDDNDVADECEIEANPSLDCDQDDVLDSCEANGGVDSDGDGVVDECDECPLDPANDADGDGVCGDADVCPGFDDHLDCNGNSIPDGCDILNGTVPDCNGNGIPDSCDIAINPASDCNHNGILDACDISKGLVTDCNHNGKPDVCEIDSNPALDCNKNGSLDSCDINQGDAVDCDDNLKPDVCEIESNPALDCNKNQILDRCETGGDVDSDNDGIVDLCDKCPNDAANDDDDDGVCGDVDVCPGFDDHQDSDGNGTPDGCDGDGPPAPFDLFALLCGNGAAQGVLATILTVVGIVGMRRRRRRDIHA